VDGFEGRSMYRLPGLIHLDTLTKIIFAAVYDHARMPVRSSCKKVRNNNVDTTETRRKVETEG
jgi:hypothetical protein